VAEHAGFAAAITVRERVLRVALNAGYANGSDSSKPFVEDLSGDGIGMKPDLFLGPPDIDCEGATNRLVATLPMWGTVTVTQNEVSHVVSVNGEVELAIAPAFTTGPAGSSTGSSLVLHPINTVIDARRWTATVTSATPQDVAALVAGDAFRARFEETFRLGFLAGRVSLPSIDASFLGPIVRKASSVDARIRDGALMVGLNYSDDTHTLNGDPGQLHDFAVNHDVAGVIHPDAVDILLNDVHDDIVEGVAAEDATLESFSVRARNGHFRVSGAASKSTGTVNFSFRIVPSMFHTRPGAYFRYEFKPVRIRSRTWPALGFHVEDVETDVDRAWWVVLFGEVLLGILTLGLSILVIEGIVQATEANFGAKVKAAKSGAPVARIRRTVPPPGGIGVRISLETFDITDSGIFIGISVQDQASSSKLLGPTVVPATYQNDVLRYILRPPPGVAVIDPALRVQWTLEDRTNNLVLRDVDGPVEGRLRFEFSPGSFAAGDFRIVARLYRQLGVADNDLATHAVNLHVRPALPADAYVRWRWKAETPQMVVDSASDTWTFLGKRFVFRYSEWHRTDTPCHAVNAPSRYRYEIEQADRLPFSLRLLENHRKGLCPYCFFGGPAGTNASL
jgi:hypothetical protein